MVTETTETDRADLSVGPSVNLSELAATGQGFLSRWRPEMGNPDEVIRRKGFDYLREMERKNGFLYGVLRTRVQSLLSKKWNVRPASGEPRDLAIAAFVREALERVEGSFMDDLRNIAGAIRYGYSLAELVWEPWDSTRHGERIALRAIKDKPPEYFMFEADAYGNLKGLRHRFGTDRRLLPLNKFVHFAFEAEGENPYGHGLLSRSFWHDWFMREGWKFWAVYLERFGSPLVRATVPRGTTPAERKELEDLISSIQQRTGIVIPEGFALEFVEATRSGVAGYREFIEEQKEAIAVVVLGQTLTTYVGSRGSQALGTVHQHTKDDIIAADAEAMATVVNEQIIKRLVDANFAGVERYPAWTWEMTDLRDLEAFARVVVRLRNTGIRVPVEWAYRTFGIPIPQPGEEVLADSGRRDGALPTMSGSQPSGQGPGGDEPRSE